MKPRYFFTSLTRISDLPEVSFSVEPLSRRGWEAGEYVLGEVTSPPNRLSRIELSSGRMVEVAEGDRTPARSTSSISWTRVCIPPWAPCSPHRTPTP